MDAENQPLQENLEPQYRHSSHILLLSGVRGDTRRYRILHLFQQLRLVGLKVTLSHLTDPRLSQKARGADLVILHRIPYDRFVTRMIADVQQRGGLVLADIDDLTFDPAAFRWINSPDFADPNRASLYQAEMQLQRLTIEACNAVLTSTNFLAETVKALGKPAWVHRNAANLELAQLSAQARQQRPSSEGRLVIGYASGTPTHNKDFALIAPALQAFLTRHLEAELWLLGYLSLDSSWQPYSKRIRRINPVAWRELPARLVQFDINLAPLVMDNPFAQSKSEIKYMEAALVGVPTLASPTESFAHAIRHNQNGLLASSQAEWTAGLEQLSQAQERVRLGAAAQRHVLQEYTAEKRAVEIVSTLNQITSHFNHAMKFPTPFNQIPEDVTPYLWQIKFENQPTLFQMGLYSLRQRGVGVLFKQMRVFFRRLIAPVFPYPSTRKKEMP
jgi:glycosyltransferase involved in cell wall biosynthesis